ncbi:solute carrier family 15 member 4-like [Convolutriloba macropyga]|uniref:solute carrier family 15 member 4-like n=1 Tax=Convolutriloba macropyga TaxID=536237 RepID=UPI003F5278CD
MNEPSSTDKIKPVSIIEMGSIQPPQFVRQPSASFVINSRINEKEHSQAQQESKTQSMSELESYSLGNRPRGTTTFIETVVRDLFMQLPYDATYSSISDEKRRRKLALTLISLSILFESCAFYTAIYSFIPVVDAKPYGWSTLVAFNVISLVNVLQYFAAFIATCLTDTYFERFKVIISGYVIYMVGYAIFVFFQLFDGNKCSFASFLIVSQIDPNFGKYCAPFIVVSLCVIGFGSGIYTGNILIFGADQATNLNKVPVFFHVYYWCNKLGGVISCYMLNYALIKIVSKYDQKHEYDYSATVSLACLIISFLCFLGGKRLYYYRPKQKDLAPTVLGIIVKFFSHETKKKHLDYQAEVASNPTRRESLTRFDFVKLDNNGSYRADVVDAVQQMTKVFFVFLSFVPFYILESQYEPSYRVQGMRSAYPSWARKNLSDEYTSDKYKIVFPTTWFCEGIMMLTIIVFLPTLGLLSAGVPRRMFERIVMWLRVRRRASSEEEMERIRFITIYDPFRITLGFLLAGLSVATAGIVDSVRRHNYDQCVHSHSQDQLGTCYIIQYINGVANKAASEHVMEFYVQWPQFVLAAFSQIFVIVTAYQFAYLQAPDNEYAQSPAKEHLNSTGFAMQLKSCVTFTYQKKPKAKSFAFGNNKYLCVHTSNSRLLSNQKPAIRRKDTAWIDQYLESMKEYKAT